MAQALLAGRICDIVRHAQAGDLEIARNLVANTPSIDWVQRLPADTYAALLGLQMEQLSEIDEVLQEVMAL